IDVLYTLDVNEFQGHRSLQMILKEYRLSQTIASREYAEHSEYGHICRCMENGGAISPETAEQVIPVRDDFVCIYSKLKREISLGHEVYSIRALRHFLRASGMEMNYSKLKFILQILDEMRILRVTEADPDREIYHFEYISAKGKVDLEKSAVLHKLYSLCATEY
ncbi:MAG: hypothetical protein IIW82_04690, partial [Clostridia bacterium]|nr:hypothetical protein [Clostridia bacterium]